MQPCFKRVSRVYSNCIVPVGGPQPASLGELEHDESTAGFANWVALSGCLIASGVGALRWPGERPTPSPLSTSLRVTNHSLI